MDTSAPSHGRRNMVKRPTSLQILTYFESNSPGHDRHERSGRTAGGRCGTADPNDGERHDEGGGGTGTQPAGTIKARHTKLRASRTLREAIQF
jgi:hypothetical protein